eukprot:scaffold10887_cov109-Isochrysis_galbana.AAC.8
MLQRSSWIAQQEKKVCGGGKGGQEKKLNLGGTGGGEGGVISHTWARTQISLATAGRPIVCGGLRWVGGSLEAAQALPPARCAAQRCSRPGGEPRAPAAAVTNPCPARPSRPAHYLTPPLPLPPTPPRPATRAIRGGASRLLSSRRTLPCTARFVRLKPPTDRKCAWRRRYGARDRL